MSISVEEKKVERLCVLYAQVHEECTESGLAMSDDFFDQFPTARDLFLASTPAAVWEEKLSALLKFYLRQKATMEWDFSDAEAQRFVP